MSAQTQTTTDPRKIDNLQARAFEIREQICRLQLEWYQAVEQQLHRINPKKTPSSIRVKINDLHDDLTLVISEYLDRRRI